MTADEIVPWFRAAARSGALELPPPGLGSSGARFEALWELGRSDLSHARLGEAHADAVAILAEAGREPPPEQEGLAVWAAEGPASRVAAELDADTVHLRGVKRWCSGAGIVSHALITAHDGGRALLVLVPMGAPGVDVTDDGWAAPAFSATCTRRVEFEVTLPATAVVGPPGFYLDRPGFWYGAIGVAACWGGGAAGLVDAVQAELDAKLAQRGAA